MKNLKPLLFAILFLVSGDAVAHATIIDKVIVQKKAVEIETKLTQHRYLVYCLTALGVAHELYKWAPMIRDFYAIRSAGSDAEQKEKLSMWQSFKAGCRYLFYTQDGWVSIAHSGLSIGGFVMISKACEEFVHPDTLRWYINTYAPYHVTIKMMKERIADLQDQSLAQEYRKVSEQIVHLSYDRLVRQAELACAYMTYKIKHLDDEEKAIAEKAKTLMIQCQNDWLTRISTQLNAVDHDYSALDTLLDSYEEAIRLQMNHFAAIEGETPRDRAAVKRKIKSKERELS